MPASAAGDNAPRRAPAAQNRCRPRDYEAPSLGTDCTAMTPLGRVRRAPPRGGSKMVSRKCWQTAHFMANERTLKRKGADYHHGDLRRSLVEATVRLVAQNGVDGFTLRAAAKLAGVSD